MCMHKFSPSFTFFLSFFLSFLFFFFKKKGERIFPELNYHHVQFRAIFKNKKMNAHTVAALRTLPPAPANRLLSSWDNGAVFVMNSRSARCWSVPPHLSPKAIKADFSLSPPTSSSSCMLCKCQGNKIKMCEKNGRYGIDR